jgi:Cu/Ag efflux protein CusF
VIQPKNPGGFVMKNVSRVALSVLAFVFFVSMVGIFPTRASDRNQAGKEQQAPQAQTVSGKIASVDKSSFTLTVSSSTSKQMSNEAAGAKTMQFQVDKNTTIEGQLQVGANADVTYRQEGGNNIAISVHVS